MKIQKTLIAMAVALGLSTSARADMLWTFDTDATGGSDPGGSFNSGNFVWDSTYQAVQAVATVGGWTMGSTGPRFEFSWPSQSAMTIASDANHNIYSRISFDVFVNDNSFNWWNSTEQNWFQIHYAGNSDGTAGWTQDGAGSPSGSVDFSWLPGANDQTWTIDASFAQMGWQPGDTWFQVFFGANSDATTGLEFYIDNIHVYSVPEPSTFALAGLGAAALLIFRRRK